MSDVMIEWVLDGQATNLAAVTDEYLAEMLAHTAEQTRQDVRRKLADVRCPQHNNEARITVTASYDSAAEQMELSYHVDACCSLLLMRAVQALNH
jgi:hypothetical protein